MTPAAIAQNIASYYRGNPNGNWRQGSFGNRITGCCLFGATRGICSGEDLYLFERAFAKQAGYPLATLVYFNDHIAKNVYDVLAVLDKVAASR